ncbi:MAG: hypothetical protein LBH98_10115 [Chitinispirillales bacterium]|jgi:hypothetical protein|nr:hypothetical protein [Chitinispirillales bacterium]
MENQDIESQGDTFSDYSVNSNPNHINPKFYSSRRWWLALITLVGVFGCVMYGIWKGEEIYGSVLMTLCSVPLAFMGATTIDKIFENSRKDK